MASNRRTVTNATQLQQALDDASSALGSAPISIIYIDEDVINLTATINLPNDFNTPGKHLIIEGNGCTIRPQVAGALTHLMKMSTTFAAGTILKSRITFKNINFNGRSGALPITGLELTGTTQSEIINCRFINCATGVKLQYAPQTRIINCFASNITGIAIDINKYTAVAPSNLYGSPFCRVENLVVSQANGMFAAINLVASGNCVISQYTSTGPVANQPNYHIYFDSDFYEDANSITIDNVNFNTAANIAAISLSMFGGYARITDIVSNVNQVLVEASDQQTNGQATKPRIYLSHYPRISSGTQFRTGKGCQPNDIIWEFFDVTGDPGNPGGRGIFAPTRWWLANVPLHRYSEYFEFSTQDKEIVTNSMKVNTNVIS
jgi:hypothetical protein